MILHYANWHSSWFKRLQPHPSLCGPAAIYNALLVMNRAHGLSPGRIARWCGTDEHGTDDECMRRGLNRLGQPWEYFSSDRPVLAREWVVHHIVDRAQPVILCVDDWRHWVTVLGHLGDDTLHVFDPARWKKDLEQSNLYHLSPNALVERWGGRESRRCSWARDLPVFGGYAIIR